MIYYWWKCFFGYFICWFFVCFFDWGVSFCVLFPIFCSFVAVLSCSISFDSLIYSFFFIWFFQIIVIKVWKDWLPGSSVFLMIQSIVSKLRAWMKPKLFLSKDFDQKHENWKRLNFESIEKEEIWRNLVEKKSNFFFENLHFWSEIEKLRCF